MARLSLRGIRFDGEDYLSVKDLLFYLAHAAEKPNLNDDHREVIEAIIKDIRARTVEDENRAAPC